MPKTALPEKHWITAFGQSSRASAQQPLWVRTDWGQLGFDSAHRGQNPYENVLNIDNVGQLDIAWMYYPDTIDNTPSPAIANGLVYVKAGEKIHAVDAISGALKWSRYLGEWGTGGKWNFSSSPAVADGSVFVASGDGKIYALNAFTGAIKWVYSTGVDITSSLTVANGIVYAAIMSEPGSQAYLYALDAANGSLKWSTPLQWWTPASPTVAGGIVYVVGVNHLHAFNAATGAHLWDYEPGSGNYTYSTASVYGSTVYVYFNDGLHALDAVSGLNKWIYKMNSAPYPSGHNAPVVAGGLVLAIGGRTIDALNSADGSLKWHYDIPEENNSEVSNDSAALVNGVLYVAAGISYWPDPEDSNTWYSDKSLYAFDITNGNLLANIVDGGWSTFEGTPVIANGIVYLSNGSGALALKPAQKKE